MIDEYTNIEQLVSEAEQLVERRNPEALPLAEQLVELAAQNGNIRHVAQANYILAFYYCIVANDYDRSIELCGEVLSLQASEDLSDITYKIYMTLGNCYQLKGDLFVAQEWYMKGLKQLEAKKELSKRDKGFLASFYYNLALVLETSQLNISAEDYLQKAIELFSEIENLFKLSKAYGAYAFIFEARKEYGKAVELLHKALEIDTRTSDSFGIAITKANMGILHVRNKQPEKAFDYMNDALTYFADNNNMWEKGMVHMSLGEALFEIGRKEEGIEELYKAEDVFEGLDNKQELNKVYLMLSKYISEQGHYRQALEYHRKYAEGLKSFFDVEKTNALTRAKKEFETEQKEKEAALLREKNEEIKKYVFKLERSNNELKQFAHVASHDLREPLRMISSYMNILQKSLGDTLAPQQKEFIGFALDGAARMEVLIVDLLRLAKVDANPRIEIVKLNTVAEEIKLNLEMLVKDKNAQIIHSNLPVMMADRTMMSQLFQNIIGNGIKYNESRQPTIRIKSKVIGNELELCISDNGIGIPEHLREKAFQIFQRLHSHNKNYSGSGIGLAICKKIVESMGGKIYILDNPGGGTTFRMLFPSAIIANC